MSFLPPEMWHEIIVHLGPADALQLRATSKQMYRIVTLFQSYWYRQFTWYLICLKKREALFRTGCHRTHKKSIPMGTNCINRSQEKALAERFELTVKELIEMIECDRDATILSQIQCTNPAHYTFEIPRSRFDIPLDRSDFNPSDQIYLYRFLIHNYRQQRQRARQYTRERVKQQLRYVRQERKKVRKDMENYVQRCQRQLTKMRNQDSFLCEMAKRLDLLERNKIFYNRQSRFYRGLLDEI